MSNRLLLALALFGLGVAVIIIGLLADLIAVNRRLLEDLDYKIKGIETQFDNLLNNSLHEKVFSRAYLTYTAKAKPAIGNEIE